MGSKRTLSEKIYNAISQRDKGKSIIVDLFCGGLAITEKFYKKGWSVIANDRNKYVIALAEKAIEGGFNDDVFIPDFITRNKFFEIIKNKDKYDDWLVGYVQCIWSFGNSQSAYLFGKEVEKYKEAGHELVIYKKCDKLRSLVLSFPKRYIESICAIDNWHTRRSALNKASHKLKTRKLELQQLEQLERLQQLEQLEQLEQLQRLELNAKEYKEVSIPKNAVVYCDPPYKGTAEYSESGFNSNEFWEYVRNLSKTNSVYVSEYKAPDDFSYIANFFKRSAFSKNNNCKSQEKLFKIKI